MRESRPTPSAGIHWLRRRAGALAAGFLAGALCASAVALAAAPPDERQEPPPVPTLYGGVQSPDLPPEWRWSPPGVAYEHMYRPLPAPR